MVKLIGVLLIVSSVIFFIAGSLIESRHGSNTQITGNLVLNIATQPNVEAGFLDYLSGFIYSSSIISLIMGVVFLFRV